MPVGDCETAFADLANRDGVRLVRARLPWLNQRGHLGLPSGAEVAREAMTIIFDALGGLTDDQAAKRLTPLPGDFLHEETGTLIEIDEYQHFTSARLQTLELYPPDAPLGYDFDSYMALCKTWSGRADKYRATKEARGFGPRGRVRQRAYHDALSDLSARAMGHPAVIRVAVPDRDVDRAYGYVRHRLLALRN